MIGDQYGREVPTNGESLRLEAVTTSVGFDDLLDVSLARNHPHFDTMIVVTDHADRATQQVARKHGAILVITDLFYRNGRKFNKGAAINAGFSRFQYYGWRMHLDSDIILPDNFRRLLFNHTALDRRGLYGADRIDVVGTDELARVHRPQHAHTFLLCSGHHRPLGARYVDPLRGYVPIGYFQLWHAQPERYAPIEYPYSLGDAAHDDVSFAEQWPREHRHLLPTVICYHLVPKPVTKWGENWEGRRQPRLT